MSPYLILIDKEDMTLKFLGLQIFAIIIAKLNPLTIIITNQTLKLMQIGSKVLISHKFKLFWPKYYLT